MTTSSIVKGKALVRANHPYKIQTKSAKVTKVYQTIYFDMIATSINFNKV